MSGQLECGCWYSCRCAEKAAAENAKVLLKMADLNAHFYTDSRGEIAVYVQPYEVWRTKYGGGWVCRAMSHRRYTSIEGMRKGISEIIKRKTADPSYLELPVPDPKSKRFTMPSKRKTFDTDTCRLSGSQ